jgi:hypothetical protein
MKKSELIAVSLLGAAVVCAAFALLAFRNPDPTTLPPNGGSDATTDPVPSDPGVTVYTI